MGANCCVPARGKPLPNMNVHELSTYRNIIPSPSWSFRWHNRTHIEDIAENMLHFSLHNSGNATSEVKSIAGTETDGFSDTESQPKSFPSSQWRKSFISGGSDDSKFVAADDTTAGSSSPEGNGSLKSSCLHSASFINPSVAIPPLSPPSVKADDGPSSSRIKALQFPGYQLCPQISDSRISSLKSLNECSSPELCRHSFVLSNDLSAEGSHGGSSDGWSMRTFSELVASSQRERWSFDSHESLSSTSKIFGSSILPKTGHTRDPQTCGICSKQLKEKSPWGKHKILLTSDLPISAVLFCGHVYHSECLESCTSEIEMYDPPCPVCTNNCERPAFKPLAKLEPKGGRNKISQISDTSNHPDSIPNDRRNKGKSPIMGASSSMKTTSFGKPFLKRRFSIGSRPVHSASENETIRKKRFWSKYRKE